MVPVSQFFWSVIPHAYEEGENLESLEVMRLGNKLIFAELYEKLKDITESQKVYNEELVHT
jgi:mannose-6-phosphate isomerase class I